MTTATRKKKNEFVGPPAPEQAAPLVATAPPPAEQAAPAPPPATEVEDTSYSGTDAVRLVFQRDSEGALIKDDNGDLLIKDEVKKFMNEKQITSENEGISAYVKERYKASVNPGYVSVLKSHIKTGRANANVGERKPRGERKQSQAGRPTRKYVSKGNTDADSYMDDLEALQAMYEEYGEEAFTRMFNFTISKQ